MLWTRRMYLIAGSGGSILCPAGRLSASPKGRAPTKHHLSWLFLPSSHTLVLFSHSISGVCLSCPLILGVLQDWVSVSALGHSLFLQDRVSVFRSGSILQVTYSVIVLRSGGQKFWGAIVRFNQWTPQVWILIADFLVLTLLRPEVFLKKSLLRF